MRIGTLVIASVLAHPMIVSVSLLLPLSKLLLLFVVTNRGRIWIIPLMLLAYLMPYAVSDTGAVIPAFFSTVFHNEAGVTYCMITPVILGVMLLFSKGVHKPTLSIVAYVGFIFGLLNTVTWFGMQRESWWMGILHLPLVIIALCGLIVGRQKNTN